MKFCMYCGKEIQTQALFCPYCGQKQTAEQKTENESEKVVKTEKKIERVNTNSLNKKNRGLSFNKTEKVEPEYDDSFDENLEDEWDEERTGVTEDDFCFIPDDEDLEDMFAKEEEEQRKAEQLSDEIMEDLVDLDSKKENDSIFDKDFDFEGKTLSADEEEEETVKEIKSSSLIGEEVLTADEKADKEKHEKAKKEEIEKRKNVKRGEGRKTNGRKKEVRKNIDREIEKRKVNEIEHEEANIDDDDYDNYYENVKPIDFDKQRDNSAILKVALTGIVILALAGVSFYYLFTFFMS